MDTTSRLSTFRYYWYRNFHKWSIRCTYCAMTYFSLISKLNSQENIFQQRFATFGSDEKIFHEVTSPILLLAMFETRKSLTTAVQHILPIKCFIDLLLYKTPLATCLNWWNYYRHFYRIWRSISFHQDWHLTLHTLGSHTTISVWRLLQCNQNSTRDVSSSIFSYVCQIIHRCRASQIASSCFGIIWPPFHHTLR